MENLLGELRTEEALLQRDEMTDELEALERTLCKRRSELREAERMLREAREGSDRAEEKVGLKNLLIAHWYEYGDFLARVKNYHIFETIRAGLLKNCLLTD